MKVNGEGQGRWAFDAHCERFPRHYVMARKGGDIVAFLMYVVWPIGPMIAIIRLAVEPMERDKPTLAFIMPLKPT